jgi:hypothetical protein
MSLKTIFVLVAAAAVVVGCGTAKPAGTAAAPTSPAAIAPTAIAPATSTASTTNATAGVNGKIVPGSKFSKIKIGMQFSEVNALIGTPNDLHRNETGKRWIPFYFGSDVIRLQAVYNGEGCLTYTGGNQFGSSGGELIQITVDPKGCV